MTVRGAAPGNPLDVDGNRVRVELGADPADGTGEAKPSCDPLHGLPEGERSDHRGEALGENVGKPYPGNRRPDEPVAPFQLGRGHAGPSREALGRLGRVSLLVERGRLPRAAPDLVGGAFRQVLHEHREPAGADEQGGRRRTEAALDQRGQLGLGLAAGGGRKLLAADLKQERRHAPPRRAEQRGARAPARDRCTTLAR